MSKNISSLFTEVNHVPQIAEVIRILINQLNDPDIDLREIAKNVEKEQIISLKVLRLVNSASFGLRNKISSIEEAVVLLGMIKLKTLVIASGIVSSVPQIENFDIKQFWLNSFSTATYARWLANASGSNADMAFTAGLLSDLGTILIHLGLPTESLEINRLMEEGDHTRSFIEQGLLGFTSQDVSAELCRHWKFSDDLILPIAQSADPLKADPSSKIACSIYIARQISLCIANKMTEEQTLPLIPADIIQLLGFPELFFQEKLGDIMALESGLEGLLD